MEENQELSKRERKKLNREKKREQEEKKSNQDGIVKKLIFVGLVIVAAFFIWNALQSSGKNDSDAVDTPILSDLQRQENDHVKGNVDSSVVIYEYADFQCPACKSFLPTLKQIESAYGDKVAIVFRHFPLSSIHKNAQLASQAAEAAGIQDKFWEMHDKLYEEQESWSNDRDPRSKFVSYAEQLGLDTTKFEEDMNSDSVKEIVNASFDQGITYGVAGTPTLFVNQEKINLQQGLSALTSKIESAISSAESTVTNEATDSAEVQE